MSYTDDEGQVKYIVYTSSNLLEMLSTSQVAMLKTLETKLQIDQQFKH